MAQDYVRSPEEDERYEIDHLMKEEARALLEAEAAVRQTDDVGVTKQT